MYNSEFPSHTTQIQRQFRPPERIWASVFILLAGPLNIAGLVLGWPDSANIILNTGPMLVFAVLLPSTVIALVMQDRMWRAGSFTLNKILCWTSLGFVFAVFTGPLGFAFAGVSLGEIGWADVGQMYFMTLVFGTMFGVIPYFAIYIGLPCAMTAFIAAYLCTMPADRAH